MAALGLCCRERAFPRCSAQAFLCSGFSCGAWALELGLRSCGTGDLVVQWHVGSSRTGDKTCVPCIGM